MRSAICAATSAAALRSNESFWNDIDRACSPARPSRPKATTVSETRTSIIDTPRCEFRRERMGSGSRAGIVDDSRDTRPASEIDRQASRLGAANGYLDVAVIDEERPEVGAVGQSVWEIGQLLRIRQRRLDDKALRAWHRGWRAPRDDLVAGLDHRVVGIGRRLCE